MTDDAADVMFRDWLEAMQPRLARFVDFLLPAALVHDDGTREPVARDYSRASLGQLEQHLLDRWPDASAFKNESDTDFTDGAVRYVGETLLRACGGGWHYSDAPKFAFRGRPFITLDTLDRTPISPYNLITALLGRRTGGELTKVFDAQQRRVQQRHEHEAADWQPARDPIPGLAINNRGSRIDHQLQLWLDQRDHRLAQLRDIDNDDIPSHRPSPWPPYSIHAHQDDFNAPWTTTPGTDSEAMVTSRARRGYCAR